MASFHNSILIRNNLKNDTIKQTANLIETLKKVGIIKSKKRAKKRNLGEEAIPYQESDMSSYTVSRPLAPQIFQPQQQQPLMIADGQTKLQIEDLKRQNAYNAGLLQDQMEKNQSLVSKSFGDVGNYLGSAIAGLQQRIDRPIMGVKEPYNPFANVEGNGDNIPPREGEIPDINETEFSQTGPQQNPENVETTIPSGGFIDEGPIIEQVQSEEVIQSSLPKYIQKALIEAGVPVPYGKNLKHYESALSMYADKIGKEQPDIEANRKIINGKKETKGQTVKRLFNEWIGRKESSGEAIAQKVQKQQQEEKQSEPELKTEDIYAQTESSQEYKPISFRQQLKEAAIRQPTPPAGPRPSGARGGIRQENMPFQSTDMPISFATTLPAVTEERKQAEARGISIKSNPLFSLTK